MEDQPAKHIYVSPRMRSCRSQGGYGTANTPERSSMNGDGIEPRENGSEVEERTSRVATNRRTP